MGRDIVGSLVGNAYSERQVVSGTVVEFHAEHDLRLTVFHISADHICTQTTQIAVRLLPKPVWQIEASPVVLVVILAPRVADDECAFAYASVRRIELDQVVIADNSHRVGSCRGKFGQQRLVTGL